VSSPSAKTTFRAEASSAGAARRFVTDVLSSRELEVLADPAALLTSELVTNAVLYARSDVVVEVLFSAPCVRVEVGDGSPEWPVRHRDSPDETASGHGLELVESMADTWGTLTADEGKCVWFELRLPGDHWGSELRRVMFLNLPAATYVALNLHLDQVLHELEVATAAGGKAEAEATHRLRRLTSSIRASYGEARTSAWDQAQQAMSARDDRVDIELWLPESGAEASRRVLEVLEEADCLCAAGELLTLPTPPDVSQLRRWLHAELWSQLQLRRNPQPYPL